MYALSNAITDTRRHLKDDTQNVWTDEDIKYFINEAISMIKKTIPEYFTALHRVPSSDVADTTPNTIHIEEEYENLIPLFASARCFEQDEQNYRAVKQMNEFEARKLDMEEKVRDSDAYALIIAGIEEAVRDVYFDADDEEIPSIETLG